MKKCVQGREVTPFVRIFFVKAMLDFTVIFLNDKFYAENSRHSCGNNELGETPQRA